MAKLSRIDFLDQVEQIVRRRFPLVKLERDDADFSLRINGHWTRLENLYRMMAEQPEQLEHQVERWIVELLRAAEGSPDHSAPFEEIRERIFPMLISKAPRDVAGAAMITQQVLEGLKVGYVLDSERTVSYVPKKVFANWNITLDELHETALENLVAKSDELPAHAAQDEQGKVNLILIQTMDGYDATRMLLPGLHERLKEHLGSPFMAAIPNRDILVCFRRDGDLIERMKKQVNEDYSSMPHQLTDKLFLVTPDGIASYEGEKI